MKTDVLIVGSGCSGLYCALQLPEDKKITIYYKFNILNMRKLNDEEKLINVG